MTNSTTAAQPLDLDKLEALALAYTYENGDHWYCLPQIADGITYEPAADFITGFSPATALLLIAQARAQQETADVCEHCDSKRPLHLLTCPVAVKGMAEGKKKKAPEPLRQLLIDLSNNTYFCGLHLNDDVKYAGYLREAERAEQEIIELFVGSSGRAYSREEVQRWRDDVAHAAADMVARASPSFGDGNWSWLVNSIRGLAESPAVAPSDATGKSDDRADNADFEAWAKSHGGLPLDLADDLRTDDGLALPTYKFGRTEIAWRAWANRPAMVAKGKADAANAGEMTDDALYNAIIALHPEQHHHYEYKRGHDAACIEAANLVLNRTIIALWNSTESGGMVGRYVRFARAVARDAIAAYRLAREDA